MHGPTQRSLWGTFAILEDATCFYSVGGSHNLTLGPWRTDRYERKTLYWAETAIKTKDKLLWWLTQLRFSTSTNFLSGNSWWPLWPLCRYQDYSIYTPVSFASYKSRQRSQLSMNRRISWTQQPADLNDFDPSRVQSRPLAPAPLVGSASTSLAGAASQKTPKRNSPPVTTPGTPQVTPTSRGGGCWRWRIGSLHTY